ncbi:MAG TPA: methyl-accepting chemotaxis protein, partial [Bdellovibrio sp.]|nr:methyl-accepting chemotaxis protein [Bdellovibrio sp.]
MLFSALLPVVAFAIITIISMRGMKELGTQLSTVYSDILPNTEALGQMGMQRARIGYFIWASLSLADEPKGRTSFIQKIESSFADYKKGLNYYESQKFTPEEEKNYALVKDHKQEFYNLTDSIIADLKKNNPEADAKVKVSMNGGRWHILALDIQKMMETNIALYKKTGEINNKKQAESREFIGQLLILTSVSCCLGLFAILLSIAYKVSRSVGNITAQLTDAGVQVSGAITQLTTAGFSLSQSSTESAASLEETVASLEEMSSMVKMNSDHAQQAAVLSQSSKEAAEEGQREIQSLISSMHDITQSSKKIEEIINVIDDIAFQTNLLALNASVEAARAGEQGKGFAVVAEAVRALAQRSAVAAKDINNLIKESVLQVTKGSKIADHSGEVLNNIVSSVKKVSDLNHEISAASSEQTTGIQQISKAMNQLDQSTQANAASSEEIASSSEEISAQAQQMKTLTVSLSTVILGGSINPQKEAPPQEKPKATKVIPFKPKTVPAKTPVSAAAIPFDEDRKVGSTDGF